MATYKPINQKEADNMFMFWQESGRNYSQTAKQFKKGVTSIRRYMKRFNWIAKADQIDRDKTKEIAKKQINDLTMVQAIQNRVVKILLNKMNRLERVSVADFVAITRLKLELQGDLPVDGSNNIHGDVYNIVQQLSESDKEQLDRSAASVVEQLRGFKNPRLNPDPPLIR